MLKPSDLDRYLARWFSDVRVSGDERTIRCPYCGRDANLRLNIRKETFVCNSMRRCGARGTFYRFVKDHLRVTDREVVRILRDLSSARPRVSMAEDPTIVVKQRLKIATGPAAPIEELPDSYRSLPDESVLGRYAWDYLMSRGVTAEQIVMHKIGVGVSGEYQGCVIIPIRFGGQIVSYVTRVFHRPGLKRYLNAPVGTTRLSSSECLFNFDIASMFDRFTIVEGVFDALAEGDTAIAIFGKTMSARQLSYIVRYADVPMTVKLDDDAGMEVERLALQLQASGVRSVTVARPNGDPADRLGTRESHAPSFQTYIAQRVGLVHA